MRIFLCLLVAVSAQAEAFDFGPFTGKINNHSGFANSKLRVSIHLACREYSLVGPRPSCGDTFFEAGVGEDGSFEIPRLEVSGGYENRLEVSVGVDYEARGDLQVYLRGWTFSDRKARSAKPYLEKFTIFETVPAPIAYVTGLPRDEFLAGKGRDLHNTFRVLFPDAHRFSPEEDYWTSEAIRVATDNASAENPGYLPHALLIVAGDLPPNAMVRIQGAVSRWDSLRDGYSSLDITAPYVQEWAPEQRRFVVDESTLPTFPRTIEGDYRGVGLEFTKYRPYESNISTADLSVRCVEGRVDGLIRVAFRGGSGFEFSGESALSGECGGDSAAIGFVLPVFKNTPPQKLTLKVDRISRGRWLARAPKDNWLSDEAKGALTIKLPIYDESGEPIGNTFIK